MSNIIARGEIVNSEQHYHNNVFSLCCILLGFQIILANICLLTFFYILFTLILNCMILFHVHPQALYPTITLSYNIMYMYDSEQKIVKNTDIVVIRPHNFIIKVETLWNK